MNNAILDPAKLKNECILKLGSEEKFNERFEFINKDNCYFLNENSIIILIASEVGLIDPNLEYQIIGISDTPEQILDRIRENPGIEVKALFELTKMSSLYEFSKIIRQLLVEGHIYEPCDNHFRVL